MYSTAHKKQHYEQFSFRLNFCALRHGKEWLYKMKLTEEKLNSKTIYEGKVINLKVTEVKLENGCTAVREIVEHPGGVCVLGIDADKNVLMVKQYRAPFETVLLEAPAGKLDKGEEPLHCGQREFLEETGYTADKFTRVGEFYPSVGFLTEKIHVYIAEGLHKKAQRLDEDEFLNVCKYSIDELVNMVMRNEIKDAKTVIAILMAEKYLKG